MKTIASRNTIKCTDFYKKAFFLVMKKIIITTTTFDKNIPVDKEIDYLSIDIEGGEMELLDSIDFKKYNIKVISVENNSPEKLNFKEFFDKKNFNYFDRVGQDEIFYNKNYFKLS